MPTYDYVCQDCDHRFEHFQSMTSDPLTECPECEGNLKRLIGAGAALWMRGFLRTRTLTAWLGIALIGAGIPVLAGQLTALLITEWAIARHGEEASAVIALPLLAGLCAGLGWFAGALSARLTGGR